MPPLGRTVNLILWLLYPCNAFPGVSMPMQVYPLESFFQSEVSAVFDGKLGLNDAELSAYVARVLCSFSEEGSLFLQRGFRGYSVEELFAMMRDADPVYGTAASFDVERALRKQIGDYCLFVAGMVPEVLDPNGTSKTRRPSLGELIRAGRESYSVVGHFDVFEYKREAPMFARLAAQFERYVLGLALVREELKRRLGLQSQLV